MTEHHHPSDRESIHGMIRYERASMQYIEAYDRDDFAAMELLWHAAETDEKLEQLLCDLNNGLLHEGGVPVEELSRENVLPLLRQKMPSAFAGVDEAVITAADVAAAIIADRVVVLRLSSSDQEANFKLLTVRMPLPAKLDGTNLTAFASELPVAASQQYWRAFQQAALLLRMSRAGASRAAARQATPPRPSRRRDDKEKS
jgi:hypothetical protein